MIGIMDYDFTCAEKKAAVPSLGAMKLYTYLQKERPQLITTDVQMGLCEKGYFFSNKPFDEIPYTYLTMDNITAFGKYFEEPQERIINHMIPNTDLYKKYIQTSIAVNEMTVDRGLDILDSTYYQAYVDGEKIPIPPSRSRKKFYIYDKDFLAYPDCWEILDEAITHKPTSIYMVEPIQCHTAKQFFFLREEYEKVARSNKIVLDYYVPYHDLDLYFGKYKLKLLGEITTNSDVCIYLGKNYGAQAYKETFYTKNLFYNLNLLFSYYSRNIPVRAVEYQDAPMDAVNPYPKLYEALATWSRTSWDVKIERSLGRTKEGKEQLNMLLEKHPVFKGFMGKSKNDLKLTRGPWPLL